jgi:hypothetical protein
MIGTIKVSDTTDDAMKNHKLGQKSKIINHQTPKQNNT